MENFNDFINYVYSFYGEGGIYDQKRTKEQIAYATLIYLDNCDDNTTWGGGDSLDRERVRDYMNGIYGSGLEVASTANMLWAKYHA
jgi:hypothetical protein